MQLSIKPSIPALTILVPNIEEEIMIYDRIQVFRSLDNITFTEITAPETTYPTILGTISGPFALTGKTLNIQKEAKSWTINFSSTLDTLSLVKQINTLVGFTLVQNSENRLKIVDDIKGTGAWIQLSGNATDVIGLTTNKVYGSVSRPYLTVPTTVYKVWDLSDVTNAWYKTRLISTKTGRTSAYSEVEQWPPPSLIADENLVTASIKLSDASGNALVGNEIIITPILYKNIGDVSVINSHGQISIFTDSNGEASIKLLKGAQVRFDIEETALGREIIVPNQDFDILEIIAIYPDPMAIVPAPILPTIMS